MNCTAMLAAAGIPDSPGREEVVQAMWAIRHRHELERKARSDAAREAYLRQLAAQGDKRKAVRSKVRVGQ